MGVSRQYLHILCQEGKLEKLARGIFVPASSIPGAFYSFRLATLIAPAGVICLGSALAFHGLTTEMPKFVALSRKRGSKKVLPPYPPIRFYDFPEEARTYGIEHHDIEGNILPVYSVAKTIADCFLFRRRIGLQVALEALKDGWERRLFTNIELDDAARVCKVRKIIRPYIEMLRI